ncbi:MAG: uroporphyrinogen-III C-methyltransferase [Pseudomonadota bacterium]
MPSQTHVIPLNSATPPVGHVHLVGAGPGDPDLLTLKAHRLISQASWIVHDRLIAPEILALAADAAELIEAGKQGFGDSWHQADINALLIRLTRDGQHVVRLKSGDPTLFGRLDEETTALDEAGVAWSVVPGITAASAASAALGQSLTRRQRNSSMQLVTGHDMRGFAAHDWRSLARPGNVFAVYMGIRAARFMQGHLLMQGAAADTPISIVENASRPTQCIVAATLSTLVTQLSQHEITGPAVLLYGLEPRQAQSVTLPRQQVAR